MHRFSSRRLFTTVLMAAAALVPLTARAQHGIDPVEASKRLLERAVKPQHDGSHLAQLFALRQLRDPDLASLFESLLSNEDWQVQVHALMGLAELDPQRQLDPA